MPSHPKGKEKQTKVKHAGGPLIRSGSQAQMWDKQGFDGRLRWLTTPGHLKSFH